MTDIGASVPDRAGGPSDPSPSVSAKGAHPSREERPSSHGAALGRFLSRMVEAGGGAEMCATCAFREGSMPNQMAATGLIAMHCALGTDPSPFGCHHGMHDGEPSRLCAGYLAAQAAPFEAWKSGMAAMVGAIPDDAYDPIRADFDEWRAAFDPERRLDVYQLGRAYARRDRDASLAEDAQRLSPEGVAARAEGIAQ